LSTSDKILSFSEKILNYKLEWNQTLGDGNCFYRAIAEFLNHLEGDPNKYNHTQLRAEIVATVKEKIQCPDKSELSDYLQKAEMLWAFSPDAHYPNFKESIDSQIKNGEFVHQTFIHATAFCLKCKIIVVHKSGDQQVIVLGEKNTNSIGSKT
jgi:hypothetical protein